MELEHSFTVPVPRDRAWEVLLDVERVAPCMPGATLDSVDGDEIKGRIKVKVGPISMTYAGTARFTERDAVAGVVTLEASGKETRGSGTASASVRSALVDQGDKTHVTVLTNLNVTGKPAQFGRGVLTEVGGRLIGIFADNLAAMLAADQPDEAADAGRPGETADAGRADETADPGQDTGSAASLTLPLEELNLPLRSYNSLRREGVHTVGELAARTQAELLAIENIGPASVQEIRRKLAEHGLSLGQSPASGNGAVAGPAGTEPASAGAGAEDADATSADADAGAGARAASGSVASTPAPARQETSQPDDDAIDLLSVAGLPVLKRAIPVLAGLLAAALVALGIRRRRRNAGRG